MLALALSQLLVCVFRSPDLLCPRGDVSTTELKLELSREFHSRNPQGRSHGEHRRATARIILVVRVCPYVILKMLFLLFRRFDAFSSTLPLTPLEHREETKLKETATVLTALREYYIER